MTFNQPSLLFSLQTLKHIDKIIQYNYTSPPSSSFFTHTHPTPPTHPSISCEPKFLRNQRYAKKNNKPLLQKKKAKEFAAAAAAKA
jgi:hypothetical protein